MLFGDSMDAYGFIVLQGLAQGPSLRMTAVMHATEALQRVMTAAAFEGLMEAVLHAHMVPMARYDRALEGVKKDGGR